MGVVGREEREGVEGWVRGGRGERGGGGAGGIGGGMIVVAAVQPFEAEGFELGREVVEEVVQDFEGLPHRVAVPLGAFFAHGPVRVVAVLFV